LFKRLQEPTNFLGTKEAGGFSSCGRAATTAHVPLKSFSHNSQVGEGPPCISLEPVQKVPAVEIPDRPVGSFLAASTLVGILPSIECRLSTKRSRNHSSRIGLICP